MNVDGYFTNYPSNTTVLLRRTVNGQPAMISYPYGNGLVVVTTMYSDWAYGHSQASSEEVALVRDLISWAKKPAQLPEVKPGETVSVTVSVVNNTTTDATQVKLTLLDPDRNIVTEQTVSTSVAVGQTATSPFSYTSSSTSSLGIYHIDYTLLDASGNTIQPQAETDSGRFVVSSPPRDPYTSPYFSFSINSDSEQYAYGSDAIVTINIWNNTDMDRTITAKYRTYHLTLSRWSDTTTVPARSMASLQVVAANITWEGWIIGDFFDETGKQVGHAYKGIWMFQPSVEVSTSLDKSAYTRGETVNIALNLKNKQSAAYSASLNVKILDLSNTLLDSKTLNLTLQAGASSLQSVIFPLPSSAQYGSYIVSAEAYDATGKKIGKT